jgi:hypothetical protein
MLINAIAIAIVMVISTVDIIIPPARWPASPQSKNITKNNNNNLC